MENKILRQADVYYKDELAGRLSETDAGYIFQYDEKFLRKNIFISSSLPPKEEAYRSKELFSFFKGLLPEGWYLDIVSATQRVDEKDSFGILLSTAGSDTIGAVTIRKVGDNV
ncbi:MAG: hypothetical protein AUJ74_06565 [Candidatus Omnitrophica bacterium CG1_02_44_16]|nr:MAG: hypothetical protein AUJ74_06565 [Candidatus Omnitrophica bacterium CG1_02_44_16]PIY83777.1 MAG: phosphatidylinositol kinase [Candidatus Omnitrophica bacterium CG_4_10_14_0_8_um_filter_44_12]PIZ83103.1 MAG: phosphatidylinositol kinase [Candidatus Omnitrophica bacterium CG_4_10_14_0_2_um_filter_44_9]